MAEKEDKYIVIKKGALENLEALYVSEYIDAVFDGEPLITDRLKGSHIRDILGFHNVLQALDNHNKYIVVNQDEKYAKVILDLVIAFETLKEDFEDLERIMEKDI